MTKSEKREYDKQYRLKNREKEREYKRQYYLKNREKLREYSREYSLKNKEKRREYRRQYYLKNKEKISEDRRQYYLNNKEKMSEDRRQYRLENTLIDSILIYGLCDKRDPNKVINYVGQTNNPKGRFNTHKVNARQGFGRYQNDSYKQVQLYEYIRDEIGVENLEMISLEEVPTDQADLRENYWMDKLKTRFNVCRNNE